MPSRVPVAVFGALLLGACATSPKYAGTATSSTPADGADGADGGTDGADGGTDGTDGGTGDSGETGTPPALPPAVVLFIGDGMGFAHLDGASLLDTGTRGGLFMQTAPHQGSVTTASLSGLTDSAAAGTTFATGVKVPNGTISRDADGVDMATLLDLARSHGMATAVVTTDTLTGATPATFLSHATSRYYGDAIADGIVADLPDVVLGGGGDIMLPRLEPLGTDIQLVRTRDELAAATDDDRPLVGIFAPITLPFVRDGYGDAPQLAEMVAATLPRLLDDPEGFLLVVEGARIDHASHDNRTDAVHVETLALDLAVREAVDTLSARTDREVTVLITADHECGGMTVFDELDELGTPRTEWRWRDHTNAAVPALGWGDATGVFDGARQDSLWVHAALTGALNGRALEPPTVPRLVDGLLDDIGGKVVQQTIPTDFGASFNQLDALRLTSDEAGLWIGVDGVFDDRANAVVVWLDIDVGEGSGIGVDQVVDDHAGAVDSLLSALIPVPSISGVGFEAVVAQLEATEVRLGSTYDLAGLRLLRPPFGDEMNLWWGEATVNFEMDRVANGRPAVEAGAMGATEHGMEVFVPWPAVYPEGLPTDGARIGVFVTLSDARGEHLSTQALPPYATAPGDVPAAVPVAQVVVLDVDRAGMPTAAPALWP